MGAFKCATATVLAAALLLAAMPHYANAQSCQGSISVSPWDVGNHFPDVTICCSGSVNFQWSGKSGVYQLTSASCPGSFANNPGGGQKELLGTTQGSGGVKSLTFSVPGTYYLTSPVPGACSGGLIFKVTVPAGSGSTCSASPSGSSAFAAGTPGGTSTSTGPGSAAAASGPPGTAQTLTAPGLAGAVSGRRLLRKE